MSESIRYNNIPCPICGGTDFTWGDLRDKKRWPRITFTTGRFNGAWGFGGGKKKVAARRCDTCGHLQLFTEIPDDSAKEKRKRDE